MKKKSTLTLEKALNRLEAITKKIDNENISIDDMLALFEEANKLNKFCKEKLSDIENKIKIITNDNK